jgi:DNA mismatch repair protein MutS2
MQTLPPLAVDARALKDLGFDEVADLLRAQCRTPFGKESLDDDVFPTDGDVLADRLGCAMQARDAVARKVAPDFGGLREVRHILQASEKGVVLAAADILDVARTVDALGRLRDVITFQGDESARLVALAEHLADERRFSKRVFRSFDDAGQLTDDASPELSVRRARVRALRAEAQEKLVDLVREFGDLDVLRDRNFTLRNDRYVLPVKSEFQGRVDGIVHDASQTHQTVFIEPRALLQLGNRIKIARADVIEEEQRILRELSVEIDELGPRLARDLKVAGALEAAFARGAFAFATDGVAVLPGSGRLSLRQARHPLLAWMRARALAEGRSSNPVTPNDLRLDDARCLVVSGPNAGGKTVALKTIGLLSLLARAGVPLPVAAGSTVPVWSGVFVSIGDEQSLEGGFSSFSGHLVAVQRIVADNARVLATGDASTTTTAATTAPGAATTTGAADDDQGTTTAAATTSGAAPQTLVLLDELMSGTDPAQGAALAQAVLEDLVDSGAVVVVTTHYDRLKALALAEGTGTGGRRFRNASVGVDRHGRPTFVLALDEVGTSNALDAARRFGLAERTVERALSLLAPEQKELHALLRALAEQKQALSAELAAATAERARFADETARLERRLVDVEAEKARLRAEGKRAFLDELAAARQKVRLAIEATKKGDARALNDAGQTLKQLDEATRAELAPKAPATSSLLAPAQVVEGDVVELALMPGVRLTVVQVEGDDVVVARGALRTRAARSALRAPAPEPAPRAAPSSRAAKKARPAEAPPGAEPRTSDNSLDVRGQRADEALELVDAFLDKLLRTHHGSGWILHGHGGGALKKAVRAHLQKSRYVRHSGPGPIDDGGDAWTVLELDPDARL